MNQHGEPAGFADENLLGPFAVGVEPRAQRWSGSNFQVACSSRDAQEAGVILEAEPGLVFQLKGAELRLLQPPANSETGSH